MICLIHQSGIIPGEEHALGMLTWEPDHTIQARTGHTAWFAMANGPIA